MNVDSICLYVIFIFTSGSRLSWSDSQKGWQRLSRGPSHKQYFMLNHIRQSASIKCAWEMIYIVLREIVIVGGGGGSSASDRTPHCQIAPRCLFRRSGLRWADDIRVCHRLRIWLNITKHFCKAKSIWQHVFCIKQWPRNSLNYR